MKDLEYKVVKIKVTDLFNVIEQKLTPRPPLNRKFADTRIEIFIKYGNFLRTKFKDDRVLALLTARLIINCRSKVKNNDTEGRPTKTVYLLHQFKRKEEIEFLRSVYGRLFFQISVYSGRSSRVDYLSKLFARSRDSRSAHAFRSRAEALVQTDENEIGVKHGQRVSSIFHDGDFIINADEAIFSVKSQIDRFCNLLFGSNKISPTPEEYGMFIARAVAMNSLDLSRQVGAAIFSAHGEILAIGPNEVPKGNGGYYLPTNSLIDDRDFVRGSDSNFDRKIELLKDVLRIAKVSDVETLLQKPELQNAEFMDALEYGRVVHAEMAAICEAARRGAPLRGATLIVTTYPCHMCAKHIIASGIGKVIYLEPYPKSLTENLHSDSAVVDNNDRTRYKDFPSVHFSHFCGVSTRRYRELFERGKRKDDGGRFVEWNKGIRRPNIDIHWPVYLQLKEAAAKFADMYLDEIGLGSKALQQIAFESP